jgi:hypothetical protein
VGGWPGERSWLTGRAVVARANFAAALAAGRLSSDATPLDLLGLAARRGRAAGAVEAIAFFGELLTGRHTDRDTSGALWRASCAAGGSETEQINRSVALLLARPEAQLT